MRFAKSGGSGGLPPDLISMLVGGQAAGLAGLFFGPSSGSLAGSGRSQDPRFRRGPDGRFPSRVADSDDESDSSGWETASNPEDEGEEGSENGDGLEGEDDNGSSEDSDDEEGGSSEPMPHGASQTETCVPGSSIPPRILKEWFEAAKSCSITQMSSLLSLYPGLLTASGTGLGHSALHW